MRSKFGLPLVILRYDHSEDLGGGTVQEHKSLILFLVACHLTANGISGKNSQQTGKNSQHAFAVR